MSVYMSITKTSQEQIINLYVYLKNLHGKNLT